MRELASLFLCFKPSAQFNVGGLATRFPDSNSTLAGLRRVITDGPHALDCRERGAVGLSMNAVKEETKLRVRKKKVSYPIGHYGVYVTDWNVRWLDPPTQLRVFKFWKLDRMRHYRDRLVERDGIEPTFIRLSRHMDTVHGHERGEEYYLKLESLRELRQQIDDIYCEDLFSKLEDRREVERLDAIDLTRTTYGCLIGHFRQRGPDGKDFVTEIADPSKPKSRYLQHVCDFLEHGGRWAQIELITEHIGYKHRDDYLKIIVGDIHRELGITNSAHISFEEQIIVNLILLTIKLEQLGEKGLTARTLWSKIVARTDEIYQVAEQLLEPYKHAVTKLLEQAGLSEANLKVAPLKDPVRIFEKALDDYCRGPHNLGDDVLPEAWVSDVIRASVVVEDGQNQKMIDLQKVLANYQGQPATYRGEQPKYHRNLLGQSSDDKLYIMRTKNRFRDKLPTHFRFFLNNLHFTRGPLSMLCELQVHHRRVLDWDESSHSHCYYQYFRGILENRSRTDEWHEELETRLECFDEIYDEYEYPDDS